jgi:uncharacterized protein (TIGR03083 family)
VSTTSGPPTPDLSSPDLAARHLDALRLDRDRLATLAGVDVGAPVRACPGWTLRDLLVHTGRVHRWAAAHLPLGPDDPRPPFPAGPGEAEPLAWLLDGLDDLVAAFSTTDLAAACPSFAGPATRGWWLRRQAMETTVHRWDAEDAAGGSPAPVDPDLAEGGVDEWCELERRRWFTARPDLVLTVHLHATDEGGGPGEWFLEVAPGGLTWDHGHRKGDIAVRASRSDLLLLLWRRVPAESLEVFGDLGALQEFLAATDVD